VVTSGAPSPTLGRPIAMAYVDGAVAETDLAVDVRGRLEPVDVVDLPFYKRP
ncbi:glycine cleavage T C-terminal barrel domain-containing protein, partial [Actinomadura adrarensis]